ncbi:MAG TPA: Hpt domain-containing protein [Hyphomicrobiaceae bacterium]|nr:Hpt domain-containing protein [Hyphomicrobiaceae bacterium]
MTSAAAALRDMPTIDLEHLRRFTRGDEPLICEVLQLFANQAPHYLKEMRATASDRGWFEAAHALKGCSRAVGAWELARLAEMAERLRDGASEHCQGQRRALMPEIERTLAAAIDFARATTRRR